MAESKELLEVLATQEAEIKVADLASRVSSNVEAVRKQLKRLKDKGLAASVGDGWSVTEAGREALETGALPTPSMIEEKLTPYDAFSEIGRRIGLNEDRVKLTADMVFEGNYEDLKWVWDALGQQRLRNDIRNLWFNNWRIQVKKPVPEEIAEEVFASQGGTQEGAEGKSEGKRKKEERDYILIDDMPVRVGGGMGDFDLQTAKDLASLRALKDRFAQGSPGIQASRPVEQRLPELITALAAFKEKPDEQNVNALFKELQDARFDNLKQEISTQLSRIPQPQQPKSFMDQMTDLFASLGSLKEMGPTIRGILGIPEARQEAQTQGSTAIQLQDKDGNPMVLDINSLISWRRFEGEERRADERHDEMKGLVKTVREVLPDGVAAIKDTASQLRSGTKAPVSGQSQAGEQTGQFQCPHCSRAFIPDLSKDTITCPNAECGAQWDRSSIVGG